VLAPAIASADDPVRLRLWHAYRDAELTALVAMVEAHSATPGGAGVKVELLQVAHESFGSKLAAAIPLGDGPDLFIDSHERIGDYRLRGLLGPADAAIDDPSKFSPNALAALEQDGVHWGVPLSQKSVALFVNTRLVALDRVPADLEGIAELAPTLPTGVYPLAYEAQGAYGHMPLLLAFGGSMLTDDQQYGFIGPAAESSLVLAKDLQDRGAIPGDADGALVQELFRSGRAAFAISGPWLASNMAGADLEYAVVPLPKVRASGQPMRPPLTVESVMFSPTGATRPEAIALARHLAGREAADLRQRSGALSARSGMSLPPGDRLLPGFAAQARVAVPMPATPAMRSTWEPSNQAIRKVLRGQASPADACAEAQFRFDDVRRPPPAPASTTPALLVLGLLLLLAAFYWSSAPATLPCAPPYAARCRPTATSPTRCSRSACS
jgi:arabinogalactan oligomer/maltooligosaccharide transport system permease protein